MKSLLQSGRQMKAFFDFVEEGIVVTDDRATVVNMNATAGALLRIEDVPAFCLSGNNVRDFVADPAKRQEHDSYVDRFKRDGVFSKKEDGEREKKRAATAISCF